MNVLIVSGGSFQGLAVLRNLQRASGVRLVLADCFEENVGREFAHCFRRVPPVARESDFVASICGICASERIRLIIPSTQIELEALATHRARFEELGAFVAVSDLQLLLVLNDKQRTYDYLDQCRFPVLPAVAWEAVASHLPVIAKPRIGWGGRGTVVIEDVAQLASISDPSAFVFQRCLRDFVEYSCDFAIGPDRQLSHIHVRRRIRTLGGFAVVSEFVPDAALQSLAAQLGARLADDGAAGLFNVQLLVSDGDPFVSDVNARIGTSAVGFPDGDNPVVALCRWCKEPADRGRVRATAAKGCGTIDPQPCPRSENAASDRQGAPTGRQPATRVVRYLDEIVLPVTRVAGIAGVVFDLDDTLFDQKRWIRAKLEGMHTACHSHLPPGPTFVLAGMQLADEGHRAKLIDRLIERFALPLELRDQMIDAYRRHVPDGEFLYHDVEAVLEELRRRGLRTGILTDNPQESQQQKLAVSRLSAKVDAVVFSRDSGAEKPAAGAFADMSQRLGAPPGRLLMVGDNMYRDAIGALRAGYHSAAVVHRRGTFFNCDPAALAGLVDDVCRIVTIDGVFPLLRYL